MGLELIMCIAQCWHEKTVAVIKHVVMSYNTICSSMDGFVCHTNMIAVHITGSGHHSNMFLWLHVHVYMKAFECHINMFQYHLKGFRRGHADIITCVIIMFEVEWRDILFAKTCVQYL